METLCRGALPSGPGARRQASPDVRRGPGAGGGQVSGTLACLGVWALVGVRPKLNGAPEPAQPLRLESQKREEKGQDTLGRRSHLPGHPGLNPMA